MNLADQIVKRNEVNPDNQPNIDELGIPVPTPETPEYLVARALLIDTKAHEGEPRIRGLHIRNGTIYLGHEPLKEHKLTVYCLTHLRRPLKDWEIMAFWRELKRHVPTLSRRCVEIADNLYWDIEKAELTNKEEANARANE